MNLGEGLQQQIFTDKGYEMRKSQMALRELREYKRDFSGLQIDREATGGALFYTDWEIHSHD